MGKLLHSKKLAADYEEFLDQIRISINAHVDSALGDANLKNVFKCTTATHTVLRSFASKHSSRLLTAGAGIARRVAILSVLRQLSLLRVELRRLIECVCWFVYFADHPREEALFLSAPGKTVEDAKDDPLAAGAHGVPAYYRAYMKSVMRNEPSGIGGKAAVELASAYAELSTEVYPAHGAVHPSGTLALAADRYDATAANRMRLVAKKVLSHAVAVVAACDPVLLSKLDAIDREWFDWLVGKDWARVIRGTEFGLQRSR